MAFAISYVYVYEVSSMSFGTLQYTLFSSNIIQNIASNKGDIQRRNTNHNINGFQNVYINLIIFTPICIETVCTRVDGKRNRSPDARFICDRA